MDINEANQLTRIYNTLLLIKTSGEDTITMGKCLEAFKMFLAQTPILCESASNLDIKED